MKKAIAAWKWSLGVVARSYRTVVLLTALAALWAYAAYQWLGLPESSVLMLILALVWAIVQILAALVILGGTVAGAADAADMEGPELPLSLLLRKGMKKVVTTLIFCLLGLAVVWFFSAVFDWINQHAVEVASFLTFHSQKPVSHVMIEEIYSEIELLLWIVICGFLLSFFIALLRGGWREAGNQRWKLLAGCAFRTPFLTSLLSVAVFGGIAYQLVNWHPEVPPGFWDYAQMILRFSLALICLSSGVLFWSLSLARLQVPKQEPPQI
jgi:hypothetical protein